jgi:hypothetical protein
LLNSIEFYNETIHGQSFTGTPASYLHGNVGDRCKAIIDIETELSTESDTGEEFIISGGNKITRTTGSFLEEGFFPGQTLNINEIGGTSQTAEIELVFVTDDYFTYTVNSGSFSNGTYPDGAGTGNVEAIVIDNITAVIHRFGIIGNEDTTSYKSPYNGATQEFKAIGLTVGATVSGTYKNGTQSDESLTIKYNSNTAGVHSLTITHYFKITPFYLDEFAGDLDAGTIPAFLLGSNSDKYVFESELRFDINNPNNRIIESFDRYKGSVGWYGEQLDNQDAAFTIDSVDFLNVDTGETLETIKPDITTRVTIGITGTFNSTTAFVANIGTTKNADIYQASQNDFETTFLWSSLYVKGENRALGADKLRKMTVAYVSGTEATVTLEIKYTNLSSIDSGDNFLLSLSIADQSLALPAQNKCTLLIAYDAYLIDSFANVPGLLTWSNAEVFSHEMNVASTGKTSYRGWPKDGLQVKFSAILGTDCTLTGLKYGVCAYDGETLFDINSFSAPLGTPTIDSNGVQHFNIDSTRGFKLDSADPFNRVYLETTSMSPITIAGRCGIKIGWQDWQRNDEVDTVFIDTGNPNENLNRLASNYAANGYKLYVFVKADVSYQGGLSTEYTNLVNLDAYQFELDDNPTPEWSADTKIYNTNGDEIGAIDLNGFNNIEITLTPDGGDTSIYTGLEGIVRIEKQGHAGEEIHELSTFRDSYDENPLVPDVGQTYAKITDNTTDLVLSCRVDGRKLSQGNYIINGRIFTEYADDLTPVFSFDGYSFSTTFSIPITAEDYLANPLAAGKKVYIRVEIDSVPIEYLEGLTGDDISTFSTTISAVNSFVNFATGVVEDAGTIVFDKLAWAQQTGRTNADAKEVFLYSTANDRGYISAEDTDSLPIVSTTGSGKPYDIDFIDSSNRVFADYNKGVRLLTDTYTDLIGTLANCISVTVDRQTDKHIYGIASGSPIISQWDNSNRYDLGLSGTPTTQGTLSWNPIFIHADNTHTSNGHAELWIGKDAFDSNLILRYNNTTWNNVDFSSKVPASTKVKSVCVDSNGDVYCLGEKSGSGNLVFKLVYGGGGRYTVGNWTSTTLLGDNGNGYVDGALASAKLSGNASKIIVIGYGTTLLAASGSNPMLLISDFGNDCYRLLNKPGVNYQVDTPVLYCGTNATNTFTFGSGSIEVGKVRGMVWDGTVFFGTGEDSNSYEIFKITDYGDNLNQESESIFGTTSSSYSERVAF